MSFLAFRNLWQQKLRLVLSIGGVALAMMLILLLNGFLAGIFVQVTAYLDNIPVDVIVAQDGVTNLLSATSLMSSEIENQVRDVAGVAQATPIISQFTIFDLHGEKVVAYMVGFQPGKGGGPWRLREGRSLARDDEVVLDWVMAQSHGLAVGDTIDILDETFTIVGLSEGTNSWMASFFFVDKRAAERLLLARGATSFLLLGLEPGVDEAAVIERLEHRLGAVEVLPAEVVRQNDLDVLVRVFAAPLRLMVAIAFTVGTAILGMIIYSATVERLREYGVLKAVGMSNRHLYWLVTQQGVATATLGGLLGIGLASLAARLIMAVSPKFLIVLEPRTTLLLALSGLVMGVTAAMLPAKLVARLDPARVFRS